MARLQISGLVCPDGTADLYRRFGYSEVCCPGDVRRALEALPEGEDLVLEINSTGGYVSSGFEIYGILQGANCRTVAEVQSFAASAASTVAIGCQTVLMSPVAQMMIHDPACGTYGNIRAHRESTQMLESIKAGILNGYQLKCGDKCSREELDQLMRNETWLCASEAVRLGLADGVIGDESGDPLMVMNAIRSNLGVFSLPSVEELMAREKNAECRRSADKDSGDFEGQQHHDPAVEDSTAEHIDQWQREARLKLEKVRF